MIGLAPESVIGFAGMRRYGQAFERMDKTAGTTDRITVYTDMQPGQNMKLNAGNTVVSAVAGISSVDNTSFVIDLNEAATVVMAAGRHGVYGSTFPTTPGTLEDYVGTDDEDTNVDEREFPGTFYGLPGIYTCTNASGCRAEVNADGDLAFGTGTTFTFAAGDDDTSDAQRGNMSLVKADPDDDFLYFGYWLETTEEATDGAGRTFDVQMFAEGSTSFRAVDAVEGAAEYAGAAGGIYMREEAPDEERGGKVEDATTGTFTASVVLNAVFGGDASTAAANKWKITGEVTDFMNDAGRNLEWTVDLDASLLNDRSETVDSTNAPGTFEGTAKGNGSTATGVLYGTFFGPSTTVLPSGVAGEFNANFTNGYAAGAFGATRDE